MEYFTKSLKRTWAQEECHHWWHCEQQIQELLFSELEDRLFSQGHVCDVVLVLLWLNLSKFSLDCCNFLVVLRVKGVKFGPLFDLVLIGDARQLKVFTLIGTLVLGVLKPDMSQSKLLIRQSDDSGNTRVSNAIVGKELLCGVIKLTDVCGRKKHLYFLICLFQFPINIILIKERP